MPNVLISNAGALTDDQAENIATVGQAISYIEAAK